MRGAKNPLFHGDRLGEVAGLVYVAAASHGDVIGEQLQGHDLEGRGQQLRRLRDE